MAGVEHGGDPTGGDVVHVPGDAHPRAEGGRREQPFDISSDGGVRFGDRGRRQSGFGQAGRHSCLVPEAGVGQRAGAALCGG